MTTKNKSLLRLKLSSLVIILFFVISILSPLLPICDPYKIDLNALKKPPDANHLFGTDNKGRDIFARVVYGGKISIGIAIVAAFLSGIIGFIVGVTSGYIGGKFDSIMMAIVDFILSFPSLLFAVAISVILPPGIYTVMIAISAVGWTSFARLIRAHVLTIKTMPFIDAAKAIGCGRLRILILHIAPLCIPLNLVMMGIKLGGFILTEATLSFLGLGAQPPVPTWGSMISANRAYILTAPWMVIFPGLAISITAFCFNMVGESLKTKYEFYKNSKI